MQMHFEADIGGKKNITRKAEIASILFKLILSYIDIFHTFWEIFKNSSAADYEILSFRKVFDTENF